MITSSDQVRAIAKLAVIRRQASLDLSTEQEYIDPLNWILNNVYIPEIHGLIKLAPYQKWCLREALAQEPDGSFRYSTIVWSDIKKSIKCLHPETRVLMSNGIHKTAEEIVIGDVVVSYSEGKYIPAKVTAVEVQPEESLYVLTTSRAREIIVSGGHPLLVNGDAIPPSQTHLYKKGIHKPRWINASEINVNDRVMVALDYAENKDGIDLEDLYLLGAYIGDGGQGRITTADPEIKEAFEQRFVLTRMSKYTYFIKGNGDWLRKYGLLEGTGTHWKNYKNSHTKRIPEQVFTSGRDGIAAFLSGYFDTDGCIVHDKTPKPTAFWSSVHRDLLVDCQELLAAVGINATIQEHHPKLNGIIFEAFALKVYGKEQILTLAKLLKPKVTHKRDKLQSWVRILNAKDTKISKGISLYSSDKIVSIERTDPIKTIAIQVEPGNTHITNGLITHNSTIAAAVALWRAANNPWAQVIMVANDLRQADSRCGYYLRRSIELNPELHKTCNVRNYRIDFPNRAFVESVPIDPTGEAGSNADMVIFSELWGSHSQAQRRMWSEMTLPPGKFGKSFRWVETYAGYEGESVLLRQLYDLGVDPNQGGEIIPGGEQFDPPLRVYRNREARLFLLWNDTPRLSWQSSSYYAEQAKVLEPAEFDRIHRNQWTSSMSSFTYAEHWDACFTSEPCKVGPRDPVIIAMDAAVSGDCFGVLAVTRHDGVTEVIECRKWTPPHGGKLEYDAPDGPEEYVKYLCERYNVIECCYDEYQLHSTATRLRKELVTYFRVFNQGGDRLIADKMLKDSIRDRTIMHHGDDDLREHALNALARLEGEKIRLVKKSEKTKIDLVVCLSMAHCRAVENGL